MIKNFATWALRAVVGLALCLSVATVATAQAPYSNQTNAVFPAVVFTNASQTSSVIQLGQPGGTGNSYSIGNLSVTGVALTTATFSVYGSSDGGVTFNLLNVSAATSPNTTATTTTVTVSGLYQVNIAGLTQIEFKTTSATFTATSIRIVLTAAPNGIISRNGSGGSPGGAAGGDLSGSYPNPIVAQVNGAAVPANDAYLATNGSSQLVAATPPAGTGSNAYTGAQKAPAFNVQSLAAGPYTNPFDDFYTIANISNGSIGSPTAASCSGTNTVEDVNHPGNFAAISGTGGTGTGAYCNYAGSGSVASIVTPNSSLGWTWESAVYPNTLPLSQVGAFQAGLAGTVAANPWTTGMGFYLSSANSGFTSANDWGCSYGSSPTIVDSGVLATVAWTRLTMVNDGTDLHWYINGTQVCGTGVALSNIPSATAYPSWTSTALSGTSVRMYVDYVTFQRPVSR